MAPGGFRGGGFGGGGFGGGGFRGGGFGGGGFRGGGAFGGGGMFRTGGPSRPFGRTGAQRITGRGAGGPYVHSPYRGYGGFGYRPWGWGWGYRRWGFGGWWGYPWWGFYYRPWYFSPIYIGGGLIFLIVMALIILPLAGVALAFPFNNATATGNVNYRSTEQLYYNEYWYEYEYIQAGNDITFSVQSPSVPVSFAIYNQPFSSIPTTDKTGSMSQNNLNVQSGYYQYVSEFFSAGSSISYNFTSTQPVDFFISDGSNMNSWASYGSYSFYVEKDNVTASSGTYIVPSTQDYYLVWYEAGNTTASVNYDVNYTALNVVNLSATDYSVENTTDINQQSFTVPTSGNWYFFVYFDPMNSPESSTYVTFDVTYDTGVTSTDHWASARPILIAIAVIAFILILVAVFARRMQKREKAQAKTTAQQQPTPQAVTPTQPEGTPPERVPAYQRASLGSGKTGTGIGTGTGTETETGPMVKCDACGNLIHANAKFCPYCGKKTEGRNMNTSSYTTSSNYDICQYCGNTLRPGDRFCTKCGAKVTKN